MREARFNPVAQAARDGKQLVRSLPIGDGYALLGTQLIPMIQGDDLAVYLTVVGGKESPITGLEPKPVIIREIARVPLANVRRALAGGEAGSDGAATNLPGPPTTESAEPDASTPLILGGPLKAVP